METLKNILKKANITPDLKLFVKREGGGTQTTGPHTVKLIDSKIIKGTDFSTKKEIYLIRLLLEENGEQKKYDFPMKDKNGEIHYLVHRLADFKEGSEIVLEGKSQGGRSFTDVHPVNAVPETSEEDIPIINQDDDGEDIPVIEDSIPPREKSTDEDDIDVDKIPF